MVLLLAAALVVPLRYYVAQRSDISELQGRVEYLQRERDRLAAYVESLRDPEKLEQIARQCFGMARPGEIAFVTIPEDGKAPPSSC
jgi:cell division protein FtsB